MKKLITSFLVIATLVGILSPLGLSLSGNGALEVRTQTASAQTSSRAYDYTNPYDQIAGKCGMGFGEFKVCLEYFFYYIPFWIGTQALFWAGNLFDSFAAMTLSSNMYSNSEFITQGWQITRDFANMFFILILIYIAISLVLDIEIGHANPKKMLASVVLVAVLINFSLFFTHVVIDISNSLALVFYNQIGTTANANADQTQIQEQSQTVLGVKIRPISHALVRAFSPQFLYSKDFYDNLKKPVIKEMTWKGTLTGTASGTYLGSVFPVIGTAAGITTGFILGLSHDLYTRASLPDAAVPAEIIISIFITVGIMLCVAAYCLFVAAFAFLGRIIELWIAIIFAPIAFLSYIIPGTQNLGSFTWKEWSSNLFSAAFAAPIFFFFLLLISLMTKSSVISYEALKTQNSFVVLFTLMVPFLILTAMLLKAAKYAKKASGSIGSALADVGINAAKMLGGVAIGTASGTIAWAGRSTIGAWGKSLRTEDRKDLAAGNITSNLRNSAAFQKFRDAAGNEMTNAQILNDERFIKMQKDAEKVLKGSQKLSSSSFDMRHTDTANAITSATGMNFGSFGFAAAKNTAGGVDGRRAREAQKMRDFAELLGENHDQKTAMKNSVDNQKDLVAIQERTLKAIEENVKVAKANADLAKSRDVSTTVGGVTTTTRGIVGAPGQDQAYWNAQKATLEAQKRAITTTVIEPLKKGHPNAILGTFSQHEVGQVVQTDLTVPGGAPRLVVQADVGMLKDPTIGVQLPQVGGHYADGQEIRPEHVGRRIAPQHLGLDHMEKNLEQLEQVRTRTYMHMKMLDTGYAVHGQQYNKFGNMTESGHIDTSHRGVEQFRRVFREAFGAGLVGATLGAAIAGPVGAAVGLKLAGVHASLDAIRELLGNINHKATDIFGRTGQAEAVTEAADLHHHLHAFTSTYRTPSSGLFDFLKPLSKAFAGGSGGGGGGGHSSGGDGGHGGGGHGGGGHKGGGHGGH
ncbi:MAG: hypothetical protein KBC17_03345 [Candidatus Pacebacteria bacterium]|nr:hypothetical protein [Candidatus Paceibacterota bacterium]